MSADLGPKYHAFPQVAQRDACERCGAPILGAVRKWKPGTPTPEVPYAHTDDAGRLTRVEWVCRACFEQPVMQYPPDQPSHPEAP